MRWYGEAWEELSSREGDGKQERTFEQAAIPATSIGVPLPVADKQMRLS